MFLTTIFILLEGCHEKQWLMVICYLSIHLYHFWWNYWDTVFVFHIKRELKMADLDSMIILSMMVVNFSYELNTHYPVWNSICAFEQGNSLRDTFLSLRIKNIPWMIVCEACRKDRGIKIIREKWEWFS